MEPIQEISLGITIAVAVFGAMGWFMMQYEQPNLTNGKYFESAWLDITDSQLTLSVEFVPDGKGKAFLASYEAICRVKAKSWINDQIDGRPIVLVLMTRESTILRPIASVVVYNEFNCDSTVNQTEMMDKAMRNMTFTSKNETISIVNSSTGEHTHINLTSVKNLNLLDECHFADQ